MVSESVILNQLDEEVFSKIRINSDIVELLIDKLLVDSKFEGIVDFHKENIAAFSSLANSIHVYHENMKRLAAGC